MRAQAHKAAEEGRSPTTISMHWTALRPKHLSLNAVECKRINGTGRDALDHSGNGKGTYIATLKDVCQRLHGCDTFSDLLVGQYNSIPLLVVLALRIHSNIAINHTHSGQVLNR